MWARITVMPTRQTKTTYIERGQVTELARNWTSETIFLCSRRMARKMWASVTAMAKRQTTTTYRDTVWPTRSVHRVCSEGSARTIQVSRRQKGKQTTAKVLFCCWLTFFCEMTDDALFVHAVWAYCALRRIRHVHIDSPRRAQLPDYQVAWPRAHFLYKRQQYQRYQRIVVDRYHILLCRKNTVAY